MPGADSDENPRLVELLRECGGELNLHGAVQRKRGKQRVFGVVHETVGGDAPGVAAFGCGDQQVGSMLDDGGRLVGPLAAAPR
ncbi:hypothetical protein PJL18_02624 [Paenarthrobacter nicotinovorans]|nr:hypothetical protein [Paenarthrobacter nicotinovorans]